MWIQFWQNFDLTPLPLFPSLPSSPETVSKIQSFCLFTQANDHNPLWNSSSIRSRREQVREVMPGGVRRETEADGALGGVGED